MKICLVRDYKAPAKDEMGAERVVENIAKGLVKLGHEVVMKLEKGSQEAPAPLVDNIPKDCDIIHFNQWDPKDNHNSYGIPWVASIYGGGMENEKDWLQRTIRNPHIICVSKFVSDRLKCKEYIWTCSDPKDFTYAEKKENYFLWMAGTDWGNGKGLFSTIQLAKKLRFKLKIAGTGKNKHNIKLINLLCDENIEYLGSVNGKEKAELISKAKGFILLTQLPDACPTVVGECMFSGTPIIGSTNGSMPELINKKVGFLCETEVDFVKAMLSINKIKYSDCRDYGLKEFDNIVAAKKHLRLYENMLRNGSVVK